ncbi:MAG: DUF3467 domain-containing protein [Bacteroidales bacterium]|nr:DUF3467 domain-containing protein [Bacteroidales bacterium]
MANQPQNQQEIKIELTPEVAKGNYCNLAMIAHGPNEFFMDFINVAPNMNPARVQTRVIMTPENAKQLLNALAENVQRYEKSFGEIKPRKPKQQPENPFNGIPNPFGNA